QTILPNMKNKVIYNETIKEAFAKILRKHQTNRNNIFLLTEKPINEKDPYRSSKLPKRRYTTVGLSKVNVGTKDQIIVKNKSNSHDENTEIVSLSTLRRKIDNPALEELFETQSFDRKKNKAKSCNIELEILDPDSI
ncbi:13286_t:CDS:2, partial [Racocetra persica]